MVHNDEQIRATFISLELTDKNTLIIAMDERSCLLPTNS